MNDRSNLTGVSPGLKRNGFEILAECLPFDLVMELCNEFDCTRNPQRDLLAVPSIQTLARSNPVRRLVESALGTECFAVRAIFFNKTRTSNWKVTWHQDLTIAVRERLDVPGFGPWTVKEGALHVQPSSQMLNGMIAIRLHLDESAEDNGPLRVLPGSHSQGRLSAQQIAAWDKSAAITCRVPRGGALLIRPLLLHASSACASPKPRRVIHIEFAASELPHGLNWYTKI